MQFCKSRRSIAKISAKSSDLAGSAMPAKVLGSQGQTERCTFTVTLTTNTFKFAGVGRNKVLIQFQTCDGLWSDEELFNHEDIEAGEVAAKTFTTAGCPKALRLTNSSRDGYVFDKITFKEEGHHTRVLAERGPDLERGWGTLLTKKRTDWFGAKESVEFPVIGCPTTTTPTPTTTTTTTTAPPPPGAPTQHLVRQISCCLIISFE